MTDGQIIWLSVVVFGCAWIINDAIINLRKAITILSIMFLPKEEQEKTVKALRDKGWLS